MNNGYEKIDCKYPPILHAAIVKKIIKTVLQYFLVIYKYYEIVLILLTQVLVLIVLYLPHSITGTAQYHDTPVVVHPVHTTHGRHHIAQLRPRRLVHDHHLLEVEVGSVAPLKHVVSVGEEPLRGR